MNDGIPVLPGYKFIAEQITDEELRLFDEAINAHVIGNCFDEGYFIAHMRRTMWKAVYDYLKALDAYYEGVESNAEQDH